MKTGVTKGGREGGRGGGRGERGGGGRGVGWERGERGAGGGGGDRVSPEQGVGVSTPTGNVNNSSGSVSDSWALSLSVGSADDHLCLLGGASHQSQSGSSSFPEACGCLYSTSSQKLSVALPGDGRKGVSLGQACEGGARSSLKVLAGWGHSDVGHGCSGTHKCAAMFDKWFTVTSKELAT